MSRLFRIGRAYTGLGLFATRPIKRGAYIATYRGPLLSAKEADRREARGARYMFELNSKWTIDGSPRYNVARYMNHSCKPNAKPIGRKGKIVIVAARLIEPEEEITYDYGKEYLEYFLENGGCKCAACRKKRAARRRKQRMNAAARHKVGTRKQARAPKQGKKTKRTKRTEGTKRTKGTKGPGGPKRPSGERRHNWSAFATSRASCRRHWGLVGSD